MKYLFRGGTVVSGRGTRRADILVEGEKILEVGRNITRKADQIIDVTGMLLMPGFIDAHTHFDLDVCNTTTADNFTTSTAVWQMTYVVIARTNRLIQAAESGNLTDAADIRNDI